MDQGLASFVIRFVREPAERQQARWRGIIKHVQSNTEASFTEFSAALSFMQQYVQDLTQAEISAAEDAGRGQNPFLETAQLWGEMMPRYTKQWMDAWGEAATGAGDIDLAKPMEKAMDKTFAAWGIPSRAEQERSAASMEGIARQLALLTAKLADLEQQISELRAESKKGAS